MQFSCLAWRVHVPRNHVDYMYVRLSSVNVQNVYIYMCTERCRMRLGVIQHTMGIVLPCYHTAAWRGAFAGAMFFAMLRVVCRQRNQMKRCSFAATSARRITALAFRFILLCTVARTSGLCLPGEAHTYASGDEYCGHRCIVGPSVELGDIWRFAVFGSTALTDTAAGSDIIGDVGCYPAVTIPPYTRINGDVFIGGAAALDIQQKTKSVVSAIKLRHQCVTTFASTVELGNMILQQGIYEAATTMTRECDTRVCACYNRTGKCI